MVWSLVKIFLTLLGIIAGGVIATKAIAYLVKILKDDSETK